MKNQLNSFESKFVMRILDRTPKTSLRVVRKCESGYPQVIMNDLLDMDNKPFPTLYWLTCPYLIKRISRLESDGMIKEIEERIKSDSELKEELMEAQREYATFKNRFLSDRNKGNLSDKAWEELKNRGIAGTGTYTSIKCLHAHYAYYLVVKKNPVGTIMDSYLKSEKCKNECEKPNNSSS